MRRTVRRAEEPSCPCGNGSSCRHGDHPSRGFASISRNTDQAGPPFNQASSGTISISPPSSGHERDLVMTLDRLGEGPDRLLVGPQLRPHLDVLRPVLEIAGHELLEIAVLAGNVLLEPRTERLRIIDRCALCEEPATRMVIAEEFGGDRPLESTCRSRDRSLRDGRGRGP